MTRLAPTLQTYFTTGLTSQFGAQSKRHHRTDVTYLTPAELTALLAAPDQTTPAGRRDHALFQVAVTTGLRVGELTSLKLGDLHLGPAAHVTCRGKDARTASLRSTPRPSPFSAPSPPCPPPRRSCSPPAPEPG